MSHHKGQYIVTEFERAGRLGKVHMMMLDKEEKDQNGDQRGRLTEVAVR